MPATQRKKQKTPVRNAAAALSFPGGRVFTEALCASAAARDAAPSASTPQLPRSSDASEPGSACIDGFCQRAGLRPDLARWPATGRFSRIIARPGGLTLAMSAAPSGPIGFCPKISQNMPKICPKSGQISLNFGPNFVPRAARGCAAGNPPRRSPRRGGGSPPR